MKFCDFVHGVQTEGFQCHQRIVLFQHHGCMLTNWWRTWAAWGCNRWVLESNTNIVYFSIQTRKWPIELFQSSSEKYYMLTIGSTHSWWYLVNVFHACFKLKNLLSFFPLKNKRLCLRKVELWFCFQFCYGFFYQKGTIDNSSSEIPLTNSAFLFLLFYYSF